MHFNKRGIVIENTILGDSFIGRGVSPTFRKNTQALNRYKRGPL